MGNYGFVRVAAASPSVKVADCVYNTDEILKIVVQAKKESVSAIVFPECSITGYTVGDLFLQRALINAALSSLNRICEATADSNIILVLGMPFEVNNRLYNTGVVVSKGKVLGVTPKTYLPAYNEFYEKRWFSSARELKQKTVSIFGYDVPIGTDIIFEADDFDFALEICEDLWTAIPPSSIHALSGAEIIFNLSASNETVGKNNYRKSLISQQSARCLAAYVYSSAGNGESTTDVVMSGSTIIAENGSILAEGERFSFESKLTTADVDVERLKNERLKNKSFSTSEYPYFDKMEYRRIQLKGNTKSVFQLKRDINPTPFISSDSEVLKSNCEEVFLIQSGALAKRLLHTQITKTVIGVSGGLDSTLALLVMVKAYDDLKISRDNIIGITMPGFGTTNRTYTNAIALMKSLGVTSKEISIKDAVVQHLKDIEHDINKHDVTYENAQARERTQILMDYSNKVNGLVVGTGDLSELALGWCTYNGDHMSMYGVNTGVPKTLVRTLVKWGAAHYVDSVSKAILEDVLETPVSPELLPTSESGETLQITEEVVGPYVLHDFFLYNVLRFGFSPSKIYFLAQHAFADTYGKEVILKWLKTFFWRFFSQQFKRSCLPDGPKVGSINLSPRGDWRMPSDASSALWIKELEGL